MAIDIRRVTAAGADPTAFEAMVSLHHADLVVHDPGDPYQGSLAEAARRL